MILAHDPALTDVGAGDAPASRDLDPGGTAGRDRALSQSPCCRTGSSADAERTAAARCLAVAASVVERHGGRIEHLEGTELAGPSACRPPTRTTRCEPRGRRARSGSGAPRSRPPCGCGIETGALDVVGDRLDDVSLDVAQSVKDAASAGEILIGAAASRVLAGAIDAVPAADARYRLLGLIEGAPAVRRRFEAELVGREVEVEELQASIEAAWAGGAASSFVVLGEPGIGKTRLAAALVSQLAERCALPHGSGASRTARERRTCRWQTSIRAAAGPGDLAGTSHARQPGYRTRTSLSSGLWAS